MAPALQLFSQWAVSFFLPSEEQEGVHMLAGSGGPRQE